MMDMKNKKPADIPHTQNESSVSPDSSAAIEAEVLRHLDALRDVPERDPAAALKSLSSIQTAAQSIKRPVPFREDTRLKDRQNLGKAILPIKKRVSMKTIGIIGLVLALTFGGGVTTVQASQDSLPNELLYPVKLLSEDVKLSLAKDPLRDLELLMGFTEERAEEIAAVVESGEELSDSVLDRLDLHYQMALQYAASLTDAELMMVLQQMGEHLETQQQLLQQVQIRSENQNQLNQQLQESLQIIERNRVMVAGSMEDPISLRDRMGTERPETAPDQPDYVPGEGSGQGAGSGQGSGSEGSGTGAGSGGSGKGSGNGTGSGAGGSEYDPEAAGTLIPGQNGQGGSRNGQ
jgi:hypothetical protein